MADPQLFQPRVGLCSPLRFARASSTGDQRQALTTPTASSTDSPRPAETKHSLEFILNDDPTTTFAAPGLGASEVEVRIASVTASSTDARPRPTGPCTRSRTVSTPRVPSSAASSAPSRRFVATGTARAAGAPTLAPDVAQEPNTIIPRTSRPKPDAASESAKSQAPETAVKGKTKKIKTQTYEEKRLARKCTVEGCFKYTINRGLCFRHGGGKKCSVEDCTSSAKIAGLCWKHGGSIQCGVEGCTRRGKSRGLCWAHGGGTKCTAASCTTVAVSNGFCWAHGGGKRCAHDGCRRPAYERTFNYCTKHYAQFHNGDEIVEV